MSDIHIGSLVKKFIEKKQVSVNEIARKMNTTVQNIYTIFKKQHLSTKYLFAFADILDVPVTQLFGVESSVLDVAERKELELYRTSFSYTTDYIKTELETVLQEFNDDDAWYKLLKVLIKLTNEHILEYREEVLKAFIVNRICMKNNIKEIYKIEPIKEKINTWLYSEVQKGNFELDKDNDIAITFDQLPEHLRNEVLKVLQELTDKVEKVIRKEIPHNKIYQELFKEGWLKNLAISYWQALYGK